MTAPTPTEPNTPTEPEGQQPAPPTPTPAPTPAAPTPTEEPNTPTQPETSKWEELFKGKTPEQIKAQVDEATKWENRSKGNKKQLDAFLDALGVDDPKAADPNQIANELTNERAEKRGAKVELAVVRTAIRPEIGANADALLDSRSFMSAVKDLDPADDGFQAAIEKAITDAVKANSALAVRTATTTPSGGEVHGGRSTNDETDPRKLAAIFNKPRY